jgi:DNA-binding MarR family transcriptional regulator
MQLVTAVRRANVALDAGNLAAQERLRLSRSDLAALEWLSTHPSLMVRDISRELAISTGTASELVDRLVARGLAQRASDPEDRRRSLVSITQQGRRQFRSAFRERWNWIHTMASELSSEELSTVVDFLERLHELMPEHWRTEAPTAAPTPRGALGRAPAPGRNGLPRRAPLF